MWHNVLIYSLCILMLITASCRNRDHQSSADRNSELTIQQVSEIENYSGDWVMREAVQIEYALALDTVPASPLGHIRKVLESANTNEVFVLEREADYGVHVFSSEGNYLRSIGRKGEGPGEFLQVNDFCINEDQVLLVGVLKLLLFDHSGQLIKEVDRKEISDQDGYTTFEEATTFERGFAVRLGISPANVPRNDVWLFDRELNKVGAVHEPDIRGEILSFATGRQLAVVNNQLAVLKAFGFDMDLYKMEAPFANTAHYLGWRSTIDFEGAKQQVNLRKPQTIRPFLSELHTAFVFYAYDSYLVATIVNRKQSTSRLIVVDPARNRMVAYPRLGINEETGLDEIERMIQVAQPVHSQRLAMVLYDCDEWQSLREAYPDLQVIGAPIPEDECPHLVFFHWKPGAFD